MRGSGADRTGERLPTDLCLPSRGTHNAQASCTWSTVVGEVHCISCSVDASRPPAVGAPSPRQQLQLGNTALNLLVFCVQAAVLLSLRERDGRELGGPGKWDAKQATFVAWPSNDDEDDPFSPFVLVVFLAERVGASSSSSELHNVVLSTEKSFTLYLQE